MLVDHVPNLSWYASYHRHMAIIYSVQDYTEQIVQVRGEVVVKYLLTYGQSAGCNSGFSNV